MLNFIPQRQSLVTLCRQCLQDGIAAGQWTDHLPGERELCARLQVSRPTLRTAVEQLRREGWLEVAHGRPTRILKQRTDAPRPPRKVVAILSPVPFRAVPPFVMYWVDELRDHLADAGYQLEFHTARDCYGARPERALDGFVRNSPAAAWVIYLSTDAMQRRFAEQHLPCLVAGSGFADYALPSVDIDYRAACQHAAGFLLGKGHQHIALLLPSGGFAGDAESERGFLAAFERAHSGHAEPIVIRHDGTVSGVQAKLDAVLARKPPPTAFLVGRSNYALTVVGHLTRRGRRIPQEAAVICRDDDVFLDFVVPGVARYASDPELFARKVFRTVLALAERGVSAPKPVRLMPKFIRGETAG